MDNKLFTKLEKIELVIGELQKAVIAIVANMVTKNDAKHFLTKDDAKHFATKNDLLMLEDRLEEKFVTKDDLKLALEEQSKDICGVMKDLFTETDQLKANRQDLILLEKRVTKLEHN